MKEQLYKHNCNSGSSEPIYPITTIDKVIEESTGKSLDQKLQEYNHIYLPFKDNSKTVTRQQVPSELRRRGLWITYISCKNKTTTEWYDSDDFSNKAWGDSNNWVPITDMETIEKKINEAVTWYKA